MIKNICGNIAKFAPNAVVYMITNQVDMMTELARRELPKHKVVGIGGHIDTMRFKYLLANRIFCDGNIDPKRIEAHIVGFHNNHLFLLKSTLRIDGKIPNWDESLFEAVEKAIEETRSFGKTVSDLQRNPKYPGMDSGSSHVPAKAVTDVIQAICTEIPLIAAFNILLDEGIASRYGVKAQTALSIPVIIRGLEVAPFISKILTYWL